MLEALGGPGFNGLSPEALRTTWLQKLKFEITLQIKEVEKDWAYTGCTLIADARADNKSRTLINFYASSPLGTFFHKFADASTYFKNTKCLCDLFDYVIRDFGPENVVQVITNNAMNFDSVGRHIMQTYGTIYWSQCASTCLNLILEDFSKVDWVHRRILQAQTITRFIYNHSWVVELMRKFTGGQDIVRTGITKSTYNFLSLQSMLKHRPRLKHIFNGLEYTSSPYANRQHSMSSINILEDKEFWRAVALKVMRDVTGRKPAVGSIYEYMTRVKDSIRTYYIMDECKCKTFLDIVDRRWQHQLHSRLHVLYCSNNLKWRDILG